MIRHDLLVIDCYLFGKALSLSRSGLLYEYLELPTQKASGVQDAYREVLGDMPLLPEKLIDFRTRLVTMIAARVDPPLAGQIDDLFSRIQHHHERWMHALLRVRAPAVTPNPDWGLPPSQSDVVNRLFAAAIQQWDAVEQRLIAIEKVRPTDPWDVNVYEGIDADSTPLLPLVFAASTHIMRGWGESIKSELGPSGWERVIERLIILQPDYLPVLSAKDFPM